MPGSNTRGCGRTSSGSGKTSKPSIARENLQLWEIDYNDREFEEQGELGKGSFGTVIKARWTKLQLLVAVKKFDVRTDGALEELESVSAWWGPRLLQVMYKHHSIGVPLTCRPNNVQEASLMVNLQNPNIVQFYGLCSDPPCMIMGALFRWGRAGSILPRLNYTPPSRVQSTVRSGPCRTC